MRRPLRILIDGPCISHGLRHAIKLNADNGRPTGVLTGWVKTLARLEEMFHPDEILVIWETEERSWRYRRLPEYKITRRKKREKQSELEEQELQEFFKIQLPDTMKFLFHVGIPQIAVPGLEADDILGLCTYKREPDVSRYLVISTDKDMLQLAQHNRVRVYNSYADKIYHQRRTGELAVNGQQNETLAPSPDTFLLWRTIIGDTSDSLPGIPGVGEKTVRALYENKLWKSKDWSVKDIVTYIQSAELTGKRGEALRNGTETILRNIELMRLVPDAIPKELLSQSARKFLSACVTDDDTAYDPFQIEERYPLYLKYTKRDPSHMLNFFRKRGFDFAFKPVYWNKFVMTFRKLYDRRSNIDTGVIWKIPARTGKYVWEVTP